MKKIKLDKLILRPFKESDYLDVYEYFKDPRVAYYNNFSSLSTTIDAKLVVNNFIEKDGYAIYLKDEKKVIGHFLTKITSFDYYIEFSLNKDYANKGYMSLVLNTLLSKSKQDKVYMLVHEDNLAYQNFLLKNNFKLVDTINKEDVNRKVIKAKKYLLEV